MQQLLGLRILLAGWIVSCQAFIPSMTSFAYSSKSRTVLEVASREDLGRLEQEAVIYVGPTTDTGALEDVEFAAALEECKT